MKFLEPKSLAASCFAAAITAVIRSAGAIIALQTVS